MYLLSPINDQAIVSKGLAPGPYTLTISARTRTRCVYKASTKKTGYCDLFNTETLPISVDSVMVFEVLRLECKHGNSRIYN